MSHAPTESPVLPPATEQQVRSAGAALVALAARHGLSELAFASPGRLRVHVGQDRDFVDVFAFQREACALLTADIQVFSDGALKNRHVSPDLAQATPL